MHTLSMPSVILLRELLSLSGGRLESCAWNKTSARCLLTGAAMSTTAVSRCVVGISCTDVNA